MSICYPLVVPQQVEAGGTIPITFNDPMFVGMTETTSTIALSLGQNLSNRSIIEGSGNPTITCLGNNILTLCRVDSRECVRIANDDNQDLTIDRCYFESLGEGEDHADTIQAFSPGAEGGVVTITNTHIVAHTSSATAGYFTADGWGGTIIMQNCCFQGGPYGFRCHSDGGVHIDIFFEDVFFVGPFGTDAILVSAPDGTMTIQQWDNVRNATIVDGVIVPGSLIPSP